MSHNHSIEQARSLVAWGSFRTGAWVRCSRSTSDLQAWNRGWQIYNSSRNSTLGLWGNVFTASYISIKVIAQTRGGCCIEKKTCKSLKQHQFRRKFNPHKNSTFFIAHIMKFLSNHQSLWFPIFRVPLIAQILCFFFAFFIHKERKKRKKKNKLYGNYYFLWVIEVQE